MASILARSPAMANTTTLRSIRERRRPSITVGAGKKNDIDDAWKAQQELLAERRQKAAEQAAGMSSGRYVPKTRQVEQPPPKGVIRTPKSEPKLLIEEEEDDEETSSGPSNPLGGFLGKLFGKK